MTVSKTDSVSVNSPTLFLLSSLSVLALKLQSDWFHPKCLRCCFIIPFQVGFRTNLLQVNLDALL